ncbi:hypothetical protein AB6D20_027760 (plasmid) [Vibrio splendidus]
MSQQGGFWTQGGFGAVKKRNAFLVQCLLGEIPQTKGNTSNRK